MESESNDDLKRQIIILKKKLERCEQSRRLIEQAKDHYDLVNRSSIEKLDAQKNLLDSKNKELDIVRLELLSKNLALEESSITDGLTQIFNRRKISEKLNEEYQRAKRYNEIFSVILADIDWFKSVNDNFGHPVGDKVLYEIAQHIRNSLRITEYVGRWGGEEFFIVLANTNAVDAYILSERIRLNIAGTVFLENSRITCSLGITEYIQNDSLEDIISRADIALYRAKRNRNSSCIYVK